MLFKSPLLIIKVNLVLKGEGLKSFFPQGFARRLRGKNLV